MREKGEWEMVLTCLRVFNEESDLILCPREKVINSILPILPRHPVLSQVPPATQS